MKWGGKVWCAFDPFVVFDVGLIRLDQMIEGQEEVIV
jgi:hypothetical protein